MDTKTTILIVDDDVSIINIVSLILRNAGYEVITDTTGDLHFLRSGIKPELILLDNQLGNKSGEELCRQIKKGKQTKDIPVILVSATSDLDQIAGKAYADDFLPKPFGIQQLLQKIETILANKAIAC
jgi:DNA-binding response OmpR family regulator